MIYTNSMPHRPRPRSSSLPLPFDDEVVSPLDSSPGQRPPTAFITYTHETAEHNTRVLDLAKKLRADGVACELDRFEVSPPEGWPLWTLKMTEEPDFVIVVCTETYAFRFRGNETAGKGKGATWEGRLILENLYEAGENHRVIPVVFEEQDVDHVPSVLKSATYYNLSMKSGYPDLYRALTNQPHVTRPTLGPVRRYLPDLDSRETAVSALLSLCPDPLPIEVVARVIGHEVSQVPTALEQLVQIGFLKTDETTVSLEDPTAHGIPDPSEHLVTTALEAALHFIDGPRNASRRAQLMNVVKLAMTADIRTAPAQVSSTFRIIQSPLKSSGNKRLVLEVARRSIAASKVEGRGREQVKDEAIATICGISWVYQRTGRLSAALTHAEHSLKLGVAIHSDRNTAFCYKCIGRLKRMESEVALDAGRKFRLLEESVERLRKAIDEFSKLEWADEVGDCYSLLARTYLEANNRQAARTAIVEAEQRLVNPDNKDYLDLQIVKGDLVTHISHRNAERIYTKVLAARTSEKDAQNSEIMARAYLQRGRIRSAMGDNKKALADFKAAARIWDELEDPAADTAHWEIERNADWMDKETNRLLERELFGVRVRAVRIVRDELVARPQGTSYRRKLPRAYLEGVIRQAKEQYVVDQPEW